MLTLFVCLMWFILLEHGEKPQTEENSVSIKMTKAVTLLTLNPPTADYHAARLQMHAIALQNHFTVAHIYGL